MLIHLCIKIYFQSLLEEDKAYHAAMYQQNSHKIATEHLTKLVENSPWSVKYLEARADCYEHRGLYDDAILDLRNGSFLPRYNFIIFSSM